MKWLALFAALVVFAVSASAQAPSTTDCPANMVCLPVETARKALAEAAEASALKTEKAVLLQAIEDYKKLIAEAKIELAKTVGEKTQLEASLVRYNAILDILIKGQKKRCLPFSVCIG